MLAPGETLGVEEAYGALEDYGRIYGKLPLRLLLHVAVPQRFRADFVNLAKLNFLPAEAQGDLSLDADVLFAPVVQHLGAGYFRMDAEVRRQSLMLLDAAYRDLGELRSVRVADLLLGYLADLEHRAAIGLDPLLEEYVTIERWVANAFLNPADAAARFAEALHHATEFEVVGAEATGTGAVRVRFGSIAAAVTIPLAGQQDLLEYARGYDALVSGRTEEGTRILRPLGDSEIRVGGVVLRSGSEALALFVENSRFPTALPHVWNLPHRNPYFTGREELIEQLHRNLTAGTSTALMQATAIIGLGGVGKTQLAIEYAYRFKDDYDVGWWLRAEDPILLAGDCTALALALDLPEKDAREQAIVIEAVRRWLEGHGRWLLVYDNAEDPKVVRETLPRAPIGHVLITSRNPAWGGIAHPLPLDRWPRAESVRFLLRERTGEAEGRAADRVANALGDLPLALEQAAAYCEQTGTTLAAYADLLEQGYGAELWREPRDLERTVWEVSLSKVEVESPAGAALLQLCAFLAPDNIPLDAIRTGAAALPEPLKGVAAHPVAFNTAVGALLRYSLARRDGEDLSIHRLLQAVSRDRLAAEEHTRWAERAATLMNDALPDFPYAAFDAGVAALYDRLLPHALTAAEHAEERGVALEAVARLFNQAGTYRSMRADFATARAAHQRALAIDEKVFGPDHPNVARDVNNLGLVLHELGDLDGARKAYQRALAIDEKAFSPDHPSVARDVNNLGSVLRDLGDLDGARQMLQRALAIDEKAFGPDHPNVARDVNNLGDLLRNLGDLDGARKAYQRALAIDEKAFGPDHPNVATRVNNLGSVLQGLGDPDGARKAFERALAIDEKAFGPEHPKVAIRVNNLGMALKGLGDLDGARKAFQRALAINEMVLGSDHQRTQTVRSNLAALAGPSNGSFSVDLGKGA